MVGEHAQTQGVVCETLVNCGAYGCEGVADNLLESLLLFLAVREDEYPIPFQRVVLERLLQQVEVLVQQRLRREVELQRCRRNACGFRAKLYASELQCILGELRAGTQHLLCLHLLHQRLLLHLGESLHTLCQRLRGESLAVDAVDYLAHEEEVLHRNDGVLWQELQERCLLAAQRCHLWHYAYVLLAVTR